jgi:hypothetical protein
MSVMDDGYQMRMFEKIFYKDYLEVGAAGDVELIQQIKRNWQLPKWIPANEQLFVRFKRKLSVFLDEAFIPSLEEFLKNKSLDDRSAEFVIGFDKNPNVENMISFVVSNGKVVSLIPRKYEIGNISYKIASIGSGGRIAESVLHAKFLEATEQDFLDKDGVYKGKAYCDEFIKDSLKSAYLVAERLDPCTGLGFKIVDYS